MPKRRLSDYYSFRLFVSFLLSVALMFALLMIFVPKSSGNVPPPGPGIEERIPATPQQTVSPTCQDFASEPTARRIETWRQLLWGGLATSGATKEAIQCALDPNRIAALDTAIKVGCRSCGAFHKVFIAEMNRHLIPCGFQLQRNNP